MWILFAKVYGEILKRYVQELIYSCTHATKIVTNIFSTSPEQPKTRLIAIIPWSGKMRAIFHSALSSFT
jgi:hypothetical protein